MLLSIYLFVHTLNPNKTQKYCFITTVQTIQTIKLFQSISFRTYHKLLFLYSLQSSHTKKYNEPQKCQTTLNAIKPIHK